MRKPSISLPISYCVAVVALLVIVSAACGSETGNAPMPADAVTPLTARLAQRGLVSGAGEGAIFPAVPSPSAGVEVDEYVETAKDTGDEIERSSNWDEGFGADSLHVEVWRSRSGLKRIRYWVRRRHGPGCLLFGTNEYDRDGHLLQSKLWRNDQQQKPFRGPDYPPSLFPNAADGGMPYDAFLRVLNSPSVGATGVAYTRLTPYEIVALNVWVADAERVRVPAGEFSALKVVMRTEARSLGMPGWIATIVDPFLPKNIIYYESDAPHRALKFEGVLDQGAPQVMVELVRFYTVDRKAEAQTDARTASR